MKVDHTYTSSDKAQKLLFISHDATMTGAPILFLRLANELVKTNKFEISFLLIEDGPLREKFEKIGPTYFWSLQPDKSLLIRAIDKMLLKSKLFKYTRQGQNKKKILSLLDTMDFIVANTIISAQVVKEFPKHLRNIIFYIHELKIVAETFSDRATMRFIDEVAFKVLAPAVYLKEFLVNTYAFNASKIHLLKYFVPNDERVVINASASLLNPAHFLVGACGTLSWRKGYDVFVNIVQTIILKKKCTDIHFLWLGANVNTMEYKIFINDLEKCGIAGSVTVVPESNDIREFMKQLNVFLLPSREDTYPLVVLEAATYGIPTVCFKEGGGITEFVEKDAGIIVDYLNTDAFAEAIISLKNDRHRCSALGQRAKEKVAHYSDANNILQEFIACLQ